MKLFSFLSKSPDKHWYWLGIALLLKCLVVGFLFYNLDLPNSDGSIGICNGDCPDYLLTARNLAETGTFGKADGEKVIPYAGRMPGYDVVLTPLSLFFDEWSVKNLTYLFQLLLSTISTYFLAKTAYLIFNSQRLFLLTFFIYGINSFVTFYDLFILTESFCVSALVISFYLWVAGKNWKYYLLSGSLLTWSILMRPYLLPIWVAFNFYLLYCYLFGKTFHFHALKNIFTHTFWAEKSKNWLQLFLLLLSFNLVLILVETIWITRNYIHFNKFIPVVTDVHAGLKEGKFLALMEFVQAWGGDMVSWNPNAEITLFYKMKEISSLPSKYQSFEDLPSYIFTSAYNIDSLKLVKKLYDDTENPALTGSEQMLADIKVTEMLRRYREAFMTEKPLYFYVIAPLKLMPKFLLHSGTYNISNLPFAQQNLFQKTIKIFYSGLYYFTWVIGFGMSFLYLFTHFKKLEMQPLLLMLVPFYIVALCPLVLRRIEYRYFITAYPYLTILACYAIGSIWHKISDKTQKTKL